MKRVASIIYVLGLTAAAFGQSGNPYVFLSESDKEPSQGLPQKAVPTMRLRPNNELPFYVYVRNPGTEARDKLIVVLAADDRGEQVLAEAQVDSIAGGEVRRVKLNMVESKPAPAPRPAAAEDAKTDPAPTTTPLPGNVYLLLFRTTDEGVRRIVTSPDSKPLISVRIMSPKEYLSISAATPAGVIAKNNDLYIQLGDKSKATPFRGKPCRVVLNVRADLIEGLDTTAPREGTYEAFVAPGAEAITLAATNLRFLSENRTGFVTVSADGYSHAFVYQFDFRGTSPRPYEDRSFVRIGAPRFAVTGTPLNVTLELFGDDTIGRPRLKFFRSDVGNPEVVTESLTTLRDEQTGFRIGEGGEIVASSRVKDWAIAIDSAGLYGARTLRYEVEQSARPFEPDTVTIAFDDTPPVDVAFTSAPASVQQGKQFTVTARASDPESGIKPDGVLFFIGEEPAEGKKPAKGSAMKGIPNNDGSYSATFAVPETDGAFDVSAKFTNNVGLASTKTVEILADKPPTTGTIEGRVIQGDDRAQPGLVVELKDGEGKVLDTATTNDRGEFRFAGLKPGSYTLFSNKPIDYNSRATVEATVAAGQVTKVSLSLKR